MDHIEHITFIGDYGKKVKFANITLSKFDITNYDQIPENHIISFGKLNDNVPENCIWNFFERNRKVLEKTRSIRFTQKIQESNALKYFHKKLDVNSIKYSMSNLSFGAFFTVNEKYLSNGRLDILNNTSISMFQYFNR